jgi:hypothetical protein
MNSAILTPREAELIGRFRWHSPTLQEAFLDLAQQLVNRAPGAETLERPIAAARRQQGLHLETARR